MCALMPQMNAGDGPALLDVTCGHYGGDAIHCGGHGEMNLGAMTHHAADGVEIRHDAMSCGIADAHPRTIQAIDDAPVIDDAPAMHGCWLMIDVVVAHARHVLAVRHAWTPHSQDGALTPRMRTQMSLHYHVQKMARTAKWGLLVVVVTQLHSAVPIH